MLLFVCSEAVESTLVKLETGRTMDLSPYGECALLRRSEEKYHYERNF